MAISKSSESAIHAQDGEGAALPQTQPNEVGPRGADLTRSLWEALDPLHGW
eukprot:CAMPEP_0204346600 /NCGR_PEP_ID=MMETSP0469-20131031/27306_1 /ASSEMBLY_ACC=CAM_ASM_000384 /TAXON_ID=2969 /ORGANISM="Oxyrrhis marina" /LENGTH=50 /DNA_ID=CAMNT_0051332257 /DNA_START=749 /DNA_END=898 /DNA_ORIENTATION=+